MQQDGDETPGSMAHVPISTGKPVDGTGIDLSHRSSFPSLALSNREPLFATKEKRYISPHLKIKT